MKPQKCGCALPDINGVHTEVIWQLVLPDGIVYALVSCLSKDLNT